MTPLECVRDGKSAVRWIRAHAREPVVDPDRIAFISYSHQDSGYAHRLAAAIERRGLVAWIDDRIDYGTAWPDAIEQHMDARAAPVLSLSGSCR